MTTKEIVKIKVTSRGATIGIISCEDFIGSIGAPKNMFLPEIVSRWNEVKAKNNEPERAEIAI